jgi:hypothetical protein
MDFIPDSQVSRWATDRELEGLSIPGFLHKERLIPFGMAAEAEWWLDRPLAVVCY